MGRGRSPLISTVRRALSEYPRVGPAKTCQSETRHPLAVNESVVKDIDFAYAEVPSTMVAYRQEIDPLTGKIFKESPIAVHKLIAKCQPPSPQDNFGFCGVVSSQREDHISRTFLSGELREYEGLRYVRTERDRHVFKLPMPHPGHEHFKGCSGAPILGSAGAIFALVTGGDVDANEIHGVSLDHYRAPLDILVDELLSK